LVIRILYLTTCIILQDGSGSTEDQPRVAEHPFVSNEDPSGHETEFTEDSSGHETEFTEDPLEVLRRWQTRKRHYVTPPPVRTNLESRSI
jgi:hypothetical protein